MTSRDGEGSMMPVKNSDPVERGRRGLNEVRGRFLSIPEVLEISASEQRATHWALRSEIDNGSHGAWFEDIVV